MLFSSCFYAAISLVSSANFMNSGGLSGSVVVWEISKPLCCGAVIIGAAAAGLWQKFKKLMLMKLMGSLKPKWS